jgi:integrase/recombinase XerD
LINLTKDEIERLLAGIVDGRHRVFVMLGYYHGMRRGELLALTWDDILGIGSDVPQIRIRRLKQRTRPIVNVQPLHPKEIEAVKVLWLESSITSKLDQPLVFPWSKAKASNLMRQYLTDLGIYTAPYQKSLHSLRHSCGRAIYRASKDIVEVAEYLGHKSVESSRVYSHPDPSEVFETAKGAL